MYQKVGRKREFVRANGEKRQGEGRRLSVGDPGMLILFVCLPPMNFSNIRHGGEKKGHK